MKLRTLTLKALSVGAITSILSGTALAYEKPYIKFNNNCDATQSIRVYNTSDIAVTVTAGQAINIQKDKTTTIDGLPKKDSFGADVKTYKAHISGTCDASLSGSVSAGNASVEVGANGLISYACSSGGAISVWVHGIKPNSTVNMCQ